MMAEIHNRSHSCHCARTGRPCCDVARDRVVLSPALVGAFFLSRRRAPRYFAITQSVPGDLNVQHELRCPVLATDRSVHEESWPARSLVRIDPLPRRPRSVAKLQHLATLGYTGQKNRADRPARPVRVVQPVGSVGAPLQVSLCTQAKRCTQDQFAPSPLPSCLLMAAAADVTRIASGAVKMQWSLSSWLVSASAVDPAFDRNCRLAPADAPAAVAV
ncbi:hypothetical protein IWX49DRAFT_571925 [Phyllosticta citricarpa]|uniref:Uncharacterized protein n=2 Tax=Phyllosticta TaxID=121621 RepID=A0ABR1LWV0_9PEZI